MTKVNRVASVPLILNDPYFSIWSPGDHLNDCDTQNWTGKRQAIRGYVSIGDKMYRFMGWDSEVPKISQTSLEVTATQTEYTFENDEISLTLRFSVDLDLSDLQKISEPVTIITTEVRTKNEEEAKISFAFSEEICHDTIGQEPLHWGDIKTSSEKVAWMGKGRQTPLDSTGDLITINWGYLYLAGKEKMNIHYQKDRDLLMASFTVDGHRKQATSFLVAYDDIHAINYFGQPINALWKEKYSGMYELLEEYLKQLSSHLANCDKIDAKIREDAFLAGGETLDFITSFSYRQSICAHKLIRDENGEVVFLSKECSSNGCIGTVDISYPSIPLYLAYQPELVKGMLRPIFKFSSLPVWEFDFAPHDVGRYPYATGQVYGESSNDVDKDNRGERDTIFDYFQLPKGQNVYNYDQQMPVEESGNMVIMSSVTYLLDGDELFFKKHLKTLIKWTNYLVEFGQDPDNQLCTDDFAGHLAHNCNLSMKAITAIGIFGKALIQLGETELGGSYLGRAKEMAQIWRKNAVSDGNHTPLSFDRPDSWSLKYNVVWDLLFELDLFPKEMMEKEIEKYLAEENEYGIPLDSRKDYTKADWIVWLSIFAKDTDTRERMIYPIRHYLESTDDRVPFSDWYDTKNAKMMNFKNRSVVGAMFMPIFKQKLFHS